jgi:hypothetical protein
MSIETLLQLKQIFVAKVVNTVTRGYAVDRNFTMTRAVDVVRRNGVGAIYFGVWKKREISPLIMIISSALFLRWRIIYSHIGVVEIQIDHVLIWVDRHFFVVHCGRCELSLSPGITAQSIHWAMARPCTGNSRLWLSLDR